MARRLHDEMSQPLTLLSLQLSMAQMDSTQPAHWTAACGRWSSLVLELGQNLRQIMNELQPRVTDDTGLGDALNWFARTACESVQCQVNLPAQPVTIPQTVANEIFAVSRDIVIDVLAPHGVKEAAISIEETDEFVRLRITTREKTSTLAIAAPRKLDELLVHDRLFCLNGTLDVTPDGANGLFAVTLSFPTHNLAVPNAA